MNEKNFVLMTHFWLMTDLPELVQLKYNLSSFYSDMVHCVQRWFTVNFIMDQCVPKSVHSEPIPIFFKTLGNV